MAEELSEVFARWQAAADELLYVRPGTAEAKHVVAKVAALRLRWERLNQEQATVGPLAGADESLSTDTLPDERDLRAAR